MTCSESGTTAVRDGRDWDRAMVREGVALATRACAAACGSWFTARCRRARLRCRSATRGFMRGSSPSGSTGRSVPERIDCRRRSGRGQRAYTGVDCSGRRVCRRHVGCWLWRSYGRRAWRGPRGSAERCGVGRTGIDVGCTGNVDVRYAHGAGQPVDVHSCPGPGGWVAALVHGGRHAIRHRSGHRRRLTRPGRGAPDERFRPPMLAGYLRDPALA
jgi:hypothetical protein